MDKIILPLTVTLPRKTKEDKVFALNLNIYRNAHYLILNQAKIIYKGIVEAATNCIEPFDKPPYIFKYTMYPASNRALDVGNVLPIVQKFTDDALIELGLIKDDNFKIIIKNIHAFGCVDKENPRAELEIIELR